MKTTMFKDRWQGKKPGALRQMIKSILDESNRCRGSGCLGFKEPTARHVPCQGCIDCDWVATRYRDELVERHAEITKRGKR